EGTEYISAVSMKLTPRSSERSRMACAAASSTCSPKVMVPRQMGDTCREDCPRETWFFICRRVVVRVDGWQWLRCRAACAWASRRLGSLAAPTADLGRAADAGGV